MDSKKLIIASLAAISIGSIGFSAFQAIKFSEATSTISTRDSEISQLKQEISTLKINLLTAQAEASREAAHAAEVKADLNKQILKSDAISSDVQLKEKQLSEEKIKSEATQAALQKELSKLPPVPVRISYRKAILSNGLVIKISNISSKYLPILLTVRNPTTGASKQFTLQIAPGTFSEIGHREGWSFSSGDKVSITSANFESIEDTTQ